MRRMVRLLLLVLVVLAVVIGVLRLTLRLPSLDGRVASAALPADPATPLSAALLPQAQAHPGLTGIWPLWPGGDAYAARVLLARAAHQSIDARYYIWQRDDNGLPLLDELRAAAERGVRVRLLVDDNGTPDLDADLAALNALPNFEVRVFNPFTIRSPRLLSYPLDFPRINRRMHNKSFTVDGVATIVGGRNVGDIYFARDIQTQYSDFDVLAVGQVVGEVADDFDAYWNSASAYPHELLITRDASAMTGFTDAVAANAADPLNQTYRQEVADERLVSDVLAGKLMFDWVPAKLYSDDPAKGLGQQRPGSLLATYMGPLLSQAQESLDVMAYFVPGTQGTERLANAAIRGLKVRVLTNSLEATDVLPVHASYSKYRKDLLGSGVELYELKRNPVDDLDREKLGLLGSSGASLHAKVFVMDRRSIFVGSFNFDPRSVWLNCEMGIWIESPRLAAAVSGGLDQGMSDLAWQVREDGQGALTWTTRDDGAPRTVTDEPGTNLAKRLTLTLFAWLPVEWMM